MAEEVGVEPTRHRLGISTALKAAHLTGDDSLPLRYLNELSRKVKLLRSGGYRVLTRLSTILAQFFDHYSNIRYKILAIEHGFSVLKCDLPQ